MSRMYDHEAQALERQGQPPLLELDRAALFLDLDGTIVKFEQHPLAVESDVVLRALLRELSTRLGGALAIISGRPIEQVDHILKGTVACVSGLHGQERRHGGRTHRRAVGQNIQEAAGILRRLTASDLDLYIEDKGAGLALHYRQAPEQGPLLRRAADEIAEMHGLKVLHGKMVAELLPVDASKGSALAAFMTEATFAGRTPVMVGDDVTDEDGFAVAEALGGFGVLVDAPRETRARFRLANVLAVKYWLFASLGRAVP